MTTGAQPPLPLPPWPPPIAVPLRLACLPGAVPAACGQPLADLVSVGPVRVTVRVCGETGVRRVLPGRLRVDYSALRMVGYPVPPHIRHRTDQLGSVPPVAPAPGWAWTTWTLAEHLRGDLDPAVDLAPGTVLPAAADVHPDDQAAFAKLRTAPPMMEGTP